MRKRMERINGTDMGIKYGTDGDKMRPFNDATSWCLLFITYLIQLFQLKLSLRQ
jgi:hypothetical protein